MSSSPPTHYRDPPLEGGVNGPLWIPHTCDIHGVSFYPPPLYNGRGGITTSPLSPFSDFPPPLSSSPPFFYSTFFFSPFLPSPLLYVLIGSDTSSLVQYFCQPGLLFIRTVFYCLVCEGKW